MTIALRPSLWHGLTTVTLAVVTACMTPAGTPPLVDTDAVRNAATPTYKTWVDLDTEDPKYGAYFAEMRRTIGLNWAYPKEAQEAHIQGDVVVAFALLKDGSARNFKILRSSGYAQLDRATLDLLRGAGPFAGIPAAWGKDYLFVSGTFHYGR